MLQAPHHEADTFSVGDSVAIERDASGWIGPCRITRVLPYYVEVVQNERLKTSGFSRTRKIVDEDGSVRSYQETAEEDGTSQLLAAATTDDSSASGTSACSNPEETKVDEPQLGSPARTVEGSHTEDDIESVSDQI